MKKILLWIWQFPQNIVGWFLSLGSKRCNWFGIEFYARSNFFKSGVCLGDYIIVDDVFLRFDKTLKVSLQHESGHKKQSLYLGWFYLLVVGVPSLCRNIYARIFKKTSAWYYSGYPEKQADKLGGVIREYEV